jgi:hypothetical protein
MCLLLSHERARDVYYWCVGFPGPCASLHSRRRCGRPHTQTRRRCAASKRNQQKPCHGQRAGCCAGKPSAPRGGLGRCQDEVEAEDVVYNLLFRVYRCKADFFAVAQVEPFMRADLTEIAVAKNERMKAKALPAPWTGPGGPADIALVVLDAGWRAGVPRGKGWANTASNRAWKS